MNSNPLGRRGLRQRLTMRALGARPHPAAVTDIIDVRRGDRPYEKVVGELLVADPAHESSADHARPRAPRGDSR